MDRVRPLGEDLAESAEVGVCGLEGQSLRLLVDDSSSDTAPT